MITVIFTALVLMVVGGVIAYVGDTWGYKLGKKRLTFLGLRPRVTANLLTVVFGVLIALFTFGALLGVSAGFRVALMHGAALLRNNHNLTAQNRVLTAKNLNQQQLIDEDRQAVIDETGKARQAHESYVKTESQLTSTKTLLQVADQKLQTTDQQLKVAQNKVAPLQTLVAALQSRKQQLVRLNNTLDENIKVRTTKPLIYANGAEVGRTVIAAAQSQTAIRRDIFDFLSGLSDQAKQQGASPVHSGGYVQVAAVRIGSSSTFVNESDSVSALADQIHSQTKGSVVVIAYAVGNAFANKPVFVRLKPYANRLVIPAGAILGETVIPSQQKGVAEILADLESFLKGQVHEAALRRGVIPVLPQDYIGGIYPSEIDPTVQQIQQIKGDTVLVALSTKDTYAGDQVSLDFAVHAASGQDIAAQGPRP